MASLLTDARRSDVAQLLKSELSKRGMTQVQLAQLSGYDERTIRNVLSGAVVKDSTVYALCTALKIDLDGLLRPATLPAAAIAPAHMGGYTRGAVAHYVGHYLTIRPAFSGDAIVTYCTELAWNETENCIAFTERDRPDAGHAQSGHLYVPSDSSFVYLLTTGRGSVRSITVSHLSLQPQQGMRGIISTLHQVAGVMFMPVAAPIVFLKRERVAAADCGLLPKDHPRHAEMQRILAATLTEQHAKWVGPNATSP